MKILVICQYYYPEPFRIDDICEEWVRQGHSVMVVTGLPNYPMGEIYEGYKGKDKRDEVINGVKVHRCFELPRMKGAIHRLLNYYSFAWSAKKYVKKLKEEFDVVFVNQLSPVMMAKPAIAYKKKHGTKVVLYCLDLWPESLIAGGIKRGSFLYKHYHKVSKKIYQAVDKIAVTSQSFKKYFEEQFGIGEEKVSYVPQYAETLFDREHCLKTRDEHIDLLFAGNLGVAQSLETIIRAAAETKDIENLHWHIVGDGVELERCKTLATELSVSALTFHGRKPLEEMPAYYQKADAMLVTLMDDELLSLTLPGKVQSYMAAGKPIIAAANGEVASVIGEASCGFCSNAEDAEGLAACVRSFCEKYDSETDEEFGKNAENYYVENFSKAVFFEKINGLLR